MGMKIRSGLDPEWKDKDIHDFFDTMQQAIDCLDLLAQLQAVVGGLNMSCRAGQTFSCHAKLEHALGELKASMVNE